MKKKLNKRLWSAVSSSLATADKMLSARLKIIAFLAVTWSWAAQGQFYDVACPGVNSELKCPEGHLIKVQSMQSGDESSADCSDRRTPATLVDDNNLHPALIGWVQHVCNGLQRCRLSKPHPRMFLMSDDSADQFIQITYSCNKNSSKTLGSLTCEGKTAQLNCESGAISIVKARFGRFDENNCTLGKPSKMTFCSSFKAEGAVLMKCQGKTECDIEVNSDDLGNTVYCDKQPRYLIVDYECV